MTWYSTCLYLTYLSQHNPLKVHPCCHKWKNLFSLLNNVPIRICSTLIYSSINEHLCSLHILSIMNNAPVNIIMYIFPLKSSFYFPKVLIYTQNGNSGSYAAAAKSLQSCPTLCDPTDCSPPGSSVHGIFQARGLEWGAIEAPVLCHRDLSIRLCGCPYYMAASFFPQSSPRVSREESEMPFMI